MISICRLQYDITERERSNVASYVLAVVRILYRILRALVGSLTK